LRLGDVPSHVLVTHQFRTYLVKRSITAARWSRRALREPAWNPIAL